MKTKHNVPFVLVVLMAAMALLSSNSAFAAARTASVSGNWSSTATWGGSSVPVAADTVTINTGITVTVDTNNAACTSVAIGTGNGTATLTFAASGSPQLTVSGSVTVGNNGNANRVGAITFTSGSTLICGSLTHGTTGSQASTMNMTAGGTLQVNGTITVSSSGATFTPGAGSVILTANNNLPNATFTSFNNLQINSGTTTLGVNLSILGNLTVNGGTLDLSTFTANRSSAGGTLTIADGAGMILGGTANFPLNYTTYSLGATSTVNYDNNGSQTVSPRTYGNLIFSGSGAKSITNSATSVSGNLSIAPSGSATANITAGITNNVGSLTLGGLGRAAGLWGGNTSGGNFTNTTYFAATTGKLNVANDTRIAPVVTTWPTASAIAYGSALSSSTLSGGSAPAGTFAFTSPSTIPVSTGVFAAQVSYSPTDTTAYNTSLTNNVNVTVNTKALTVSGITANGKIYDRTTAATLNTGSAALVGVVGSDDVSLNTGSAVGTFSSANVGSRTATVSGLTIAGVDAGKYTVTQPTTAATNITAKPLTVSGGSVTSKTYNGNTSATINTSGMALVGLINPDTATLNTGSAAGTYDNKNVGVAKPVQISGLTISGGQSANYSLTQPTNSGNITSRSLTVTANGVNKVYDGTTNATVTLTDDRVGGDVFTAAYSNAGFTTPTVGVNKTVNVSGISISGTDAANYTANTTETTTANITALAVQLTGGRIYDGTTIISSSDLSVANSLDGANVSLTGTGLIAARNVGSQAVSAGATASRVQSTTGSVNGGTSISMSALGSSPVNGNTLVAVVSTRGTAQSQVNSITQTGATWTRVVQSGGSAANPSTTEIWYAPNVSGAGTAITINLANSLRAAAVVMEYSGLLTPTSVDATNSNFANGVVGTAATTGTTPTTSQANELWIGGIAFTNSGYSLGSIQNSFTSVANVSSTSGTAGNNTRLYALERIATSSGTASSGGTISTASLWSGAVATFRSATASGSPLALTGSAANNYTLVGMTGSATITAKSVTTTGLSADNKVYDGGTSATLSGSAALLASQAAGAGTTSDGKPYSLDTVSVSGTASGSFADKNVGVAKPVTVSGLTLAGAQAGNYSIVQPSLSADITALGLTGTITADNKIYDGNNSATILTRSVSGVIGVEDVALTGGTATFNNKNVGNGKPVTATGMTLTGADAGNYSAPATALGSADITARSITVNATAASKVYDGNTSATYTPTITSGSLASGDIATLTESFDNKNVGAGKTVTPAGSINDGNSGANYDITFAASNAGEITARSLTASATANNKVYDGDNSATIATRSLSGVIGSEDVTLSGGTATFDNKNVGNGKAVAVIGMILGGADMGNYSLASGDANTTANITALALATSATADNKVYDGNNSATIATRSLSGVIGTEDVTISGGTATFDNKNVGNGKTVAVTGMILGGADAANYSAATSVNTTADITARSLTVSATGSNKVYDATSAAIVSLSDDRIGGDVLSPSHTNAEFASINVGTNITINVSGISISGTDSANYSLASDIATTAADITPRTLIVSATAQNKIYDGSDAATVTLSDDHIAGEDVSVSHTGALFDNKNIGVGKSVTVSGISMSGTNSSNYSLASSTVNTTATITAVSLAASATANNKVYDGNNSAVIASRSLVGIIGSEDVTLSGGTATFDNKNFGNGKAVTVVGMILGGADMANYSLTSGDANTTADITVRSLTVGASAANKVYDGNDTASVTLSDNRIGGDVLTLNHTGALFDNKNVGVAKSVGVSGISMSGTDAGNYSLANTSANSSADISAASLTASATANNKVYDGDNSATIASRSLVGIIGSEDVTLSGGTATFDNKNVGNGKAVAVVGMILGGADMANYSLDSGDANTTADITAVLLTASATASNKVYDGNNSATIATRSLSGVIGSEDVTLSGGTASFDNKNVGNGKAVAVVGMILGGADMANYSLASGNANTTADITTASLVASATANNKGYDGNNSAIIASRSLSGVIGLDDVTLSGGSATFDNKNVGNGKAVAVVGMILDGADMGNYSLASGDANTTADITAASLTASATANNKVYDGNNGATIATRSLSGVIGSEDVTLSGGTASFDNKNVGNGKAVAVIGMILGGADMANYSLASGDANTTADITAASLTASATANNKVYDGNNSAVIASRSLSGVIGLDDVTLSGGTASFDNKNVGNGKAVAVIGMILSGADMANYSLASGDANTAADITAASLTASATASNKVYDGDNSATIATRSLSGVIGSEDVTLSGGTASFDNKNVGSGKAVAVIGMILSGADMGNYSLASGDANTTADITAASLTASATSNNKVYDGNNSATIATRSLSGVIGSEDVTLSGGTATFDNKNVGNGKAVAVIGMILGGADMGNYSLASGDANTTADITAASLTASATSNNKVYDGNNSATIATRSLSGVIGSEDVTLSGGTATFDNKNVGNGKAVAVVGMILGGADMANYSLASGNANTTADITAASLTVSASASNKVYDGNDNASITLTDDRLGGDVLSASHTSALFDNKNVGVVKPVSVTGISISGTDAGNYSLVNTTASSSADITARSLTVSASASNKVYDGNDSATVSLSDNHVGSDDISVSHTAANFDNKNVGVAKSVSVSGISMSGADASNYTLSNTTATGSADVTARSLTITATADNKAYDGNTNAVVSLTDNRISGDVLTLANTDSGFDDANVGTAKNVNVLGLSISGTDSGNYSLANNSAMTTADITPVQLTVTADDKSRAYAAANPAFTATITGFVNSENEGALSGTADLATIADANSAVGTYPITAAIGSLSATNYTFSFVDGTMTITPYALAVSADNKDRTYGAANPTLTGSISGLQNGDNITADYATSADANSPVGSYLITVSLADPDGKLVNYSVTTNEGSLTVSAATLTVTADDQSRTYGAANPTLTATITGYMNGENESVISGNADINTLADGSSPVGNHTITAALGTLSAANYSFNFVDGNLTITPASLTASVTVENKIYDGNDSATIDSRSLSGVIGSDDVTLSGGTATFDNKNVGNGKAVAVIGMILGGADMANYNLASGDANTTADITAASLTASATANNKVYDGNNSAVIASRSLVGIIGSEDVTLSGGTATFDNKNVGNGKAVAVVGMILGGADMANYSLASGDANTTADITAASLTASATANNKVYDGDNSATIASRSLVGIIGSEDVTLSGGTATFDNKNVGNGKAVAVVGMILGGADMANYSLVSGDANTTADITAASLTGSITAANKNYDGNNSATILTRSLSGVIGSEDVTLSGGTATFDNKNVGNGKAVSATGLSLSGADMSNYSLASSGAATTANISAIALTVTADDASRNYGDANPNFTGTMTGMIAGDNIVASYTTVANAASPAGTYTITPSLNDPDNNLGNYIVTLNNGTLTIISLTPSTIGSIEKMADGNMHIIVNGTPGQTYQLQATEDLGAPVWNNILTNTANGLGVVEFSDLSATNHMSRFYRISTP